MLQADLEKSEDRANAKESKNTELEEELKEVGMNVKTLKVN
jgi:tropomyosin-1